jgi:hypothetical protein
VTFFSLVPVSRCLPYDQNIAELMMLVALNPRISSTAKWSNSAGDGVFFMGVGEHQEVGELDDYMGMKSHKAPPSSRPRL